MVWINLLFFVKAVGFTIEFTIISYKPPPICFNINTFIHGNLRSLGNPNNGLVKITPDILIVFLYNNNFVVTNPPKLWAYKNNGKSSLACFNNIMTSFYNFYIVAHPRGAPEYPNPLKSINNTS